MPVRSPIPSSLGMWMCFVHKMGALSELPSIKTNSRVKSWNEWRTRHAMRPENQYESFDNRAYENRRMTATICPTTSASR